MANANYTVEKRDGCTLVYGSVPITDMVALTKQGNEGDVMNMRLSDLAGATFAFGSKEDTDALADKLKKEKLKDLDSPKKLSALETQYPGFKKLSVGGKKWFVLGDHGMSSVAMFVNTTKVMHPYIKNESQKTDDGLYKNYPRDVDDLLRCLSMLDMVPEASCRFKVVMKSVSPVWDGLVESWDDVLNTLEEENRHWREGENKPTPETNKLMKEIIDKAEHKQHKKMGM